MSQLPIQRMWQSKRGSGDNEMQKVNTKLQQEVVEEDPEKSKPSCCRQIGLAKMTPRERDEWKAGLLAAQPKLTADEIRRYRLKHHYVMCLELEEEGLPESAQYIRGLLHLNTEMRRAAGPDTHLWRRPKLRDSPEYLNRLREGLTLAERAQQTGRLGDQCTALLRLAVVFMTQEEAWWWVAEQLFLWCVTVSEQYKTDGGRLEAITKYIYGLFLLKQMGDVEAARLQLQTARGLSSGKDWVARDELGRPQESVFRETCGLLYKALLLSAQQVRDKNPDEAIRLCSSALRRAKDSQRKENEAEVLYELALSYQSASDHVKSLELLTDYLAYSRELRDPQGLCNAHLEMAICFKNLKDAKATLKHLERYLKIADDNYLTERQAEANRYLGEYHLNISNYSQASIHFCSSFSLYYKLSMLEETEQVRCLQGIAAGHQLMPAFTQIIMEAHDSAKQMRKLIQWKAVHRPFWDCNEIPFIKEEDDEFDETPPESPMEGNSASEMSGASSVNRSTSRASRASRASSKRSNVSANLFGKTGTGSWYSALSK